MTMRTRTARWTGILLFVWLGAGGLPRDARPAYGQGAAETFRYVDGNTGSDDNPGTAEAPWRTVRKAFETATAGTVVHIAPGLYPERNLRPQHSGTEGQPIVYTRWEKEPDLLYHYPILGGGTGGHVIICTNVCFLTFEKLILTAPHPRRQELLGPDKITDPLHREGIILSGACRHIVVRHCQFLDIATRGIFAGSGGPDAAGHRLTHDVMDNNAFHDNKFILVGMDTAGGDINCNFGVRHHIHHNLFKGYVDGPVFHHPGEGSLIEHNTVLEHHREDGIDIKGTRRTTEPGNREGWWTVVRHNYVGLHRQSEITIQYGSEYVKCHHNILFGRHGFGGVGLWLHGNQKSRGARFVEIHDNVMVGTGSYSIYPKLHPDSRGKPESQFYISDVTISNNTVADCAGGPGIMIRSGKDLVVTGNLVRNAAGQAATIGVHEDVQNLRSAGNVLWPAGAAEDGRTVLPAATANGCLTLAPADWQALQAENVFLDPGDAVQVTLAGPGPATAPRIVGARDMAELDHATEAAILNLFRVTAVEVAAPTRIRVRFNKPLRADTVRHLGVYRLWPKGRFRNLDPAAVARAFKEEAFDVGKLSSLSAARRASVGRERYLKIVLEREEVAVLTAAKAFKEMDGFQVTRVDLADGQAAMTLHVDPPLQAGAEYELYVDHVSNEDGAFVDIQPLDHRIHALMPVR